jgi:hypothetical protein
MIARVLRLQTSARDKSRAGRSGQDCNFAWRRQAAAFQNDRGEKYHRQVGYGNEPQCQRCYAVGNFDRGSLRLAIVRTCFQNSFSRSIRIEIEQ